MDYSKAIENRTSRRNYLQMEIEGTKVEQLEKLLAKCNDEADLHMQIYVNNGDAFAGLKMSYGMFQNVSNYIALVGKKSDVNLQEKLGYFGEKLVLEATMLGLGSCWVGGTYDKKTCKCKVADDEILLGIITLGYSPEKKPIKEKLIYSVIRLKTKRIEDMLVSEGIVPDWVINGMKAVQKAPSAINRQPVKFIWKDGVIRASVSQKIGYETMDMGIAKLHFELGANNGGTWEFGNSEVYMV